jgi:hypothetical protein
MVPGPEPLGPADTADWSSLETLIKRFVAAWRQGPRPGAAWPPIPYPGGNRPEG